MTRLRTRWAGPPWTSVAVSGVSQNGATEPSSPSPARAGMKPPQTVAHSCRPTRLTTSQAAAVTAAMAMVRRALAQLAGGRIGGAPQDPSSAELDLPDLVIFVARRRREFDLLALHPADQRPAERRGVADPARLGVGLGLADDLIFDLVVVLVEQMDGGAEDHLVAGEGH